MGAIGQEIFHKINARGRRRERDERRRRYA